MFEFIIYKKNIWILKIKLKNIWISIKMSAKAILDVAKEVTEARDSEIPQKLLKIKGSYRSLKPYRIGHIYINLDFI